MENIAPAKVDKYTLRNAFIRYRGGDGTDELRVFKDAHVFVPEGSVPVIEELSGDEASAAAELANSVAQENVGELDGFAAPTKTFSFSNAFMIMDGKAAAFNHGLVFYGNEYSVKPERGFATFLANALFQTEVESDDAATLSKNDMVVSAAIGLDIVTDGLKRAAADNGNQRFTELRERYGDDIEVRNRDIDDGTEFAVITAATTTGGKMAIASNNMVRVYEKLVLLVEPGSLPERIDITDEDREAMRSIGIENFNPTAVLRFGKCGMIEEGDGETGIALGEISVFVEDAAEVTYRPVWMPKEPFDAIGFTTYLGSRIGPPSRAEQQELNGKSVNDTLS